jgi:hypothetical protein
MTENNAISCRRYLSLPERKCRRTSGLKGALLGNPIKSGVKVNNTL